MGGDVYRDAERLYDDVRVITRMLRTQVAADLAPMSLTTRQLNVLEVLVDSGGVSLNQLARLIGLAHSTVSNIVDRLEKRGLIERWADPKDRRRTQIDLTELARGYLNRHEPPRSHFPVVRLLARSSPDERQAILDGLAVLKRLLGDQWAADWQEGKRRLPL